LSYTEIYSYNNDNEDAGFCQSDYAMIIALPKNTKLPKYNHHIHSGTLYGIHSFMKLTPINLYLPRFTHQSTIKLKEFIENSKNPLSILFKEDQTGITHILQDNHELTISDIIVKSVVKVNEYGTEDCVIFEEECIFEDDSDDKIQRILFNANRPFYYEIINTKNTTILFSGVYNAQ
jgi:serine protease inhibitor